VKWFSERSAGALLYVAKEIYGLFGQWIAFGVFGPSPFLRGVSQ